MTKKQGNKFEKKCQRTINSGAIWFNKGDLRYKNYLIDTKYTAKKSFSITKSIIEKIWEDALTMNKEPMLQIGIPRNDKELFVLDCVIRLDRR